MNLADIIRDVVAPKARLSPHIAPGVTLYGDSIMAGGIADRLRKQLPDALIADRSIPGDTAANAWRRFPYEIRATNIVVLQPGTNDLASKRCPLRPLRKMAEYARAEGREVVFTGLAQRADGRVEWNLVNDVNAVVREMAFDLGAHFAWWHDVELDSADALHPSPAMADELAQFLAKTLREVR